MALYSIKFGVKEPFAHLEEAPSLGTQARASLGGKYNYITYGEVFSDSREKDLEDLGWNEAGTFAGKELPTGYWVWVDPYIVVFGVWMENWEKISPQVKNMDHSNDQLERAVCNYKYRTLRYTIFAPQERVSHGDFLEFGYRKRSEYLGQTKIPEGYWIWVYPHWFIFEEDLSKEETDCMDIAEAFQEERLNKASGNGRFQELIDAFLLPRLAEKHGDHEVLGEGEEEQIDGDNIPSGYRIWCAPYLYVFGKDGQA